MTQNELYDIFTVKTDTIPSKEIYYQKLGQVLNKVRTDCNISPQQVQKETGITMHKLQEYEAGNCEIPIYDLLVLLSFFESTNLFDIIS